MHFSQPLTGALFSALLASTLNSHPASSAAIHQRQDTLDLQLLGSAGVCGNFELTNDNTFSALCVGDTGEPVMSSVNIDQCILNSAGNLGFLFNGDFSGSCSGCTLSDALDLTCNCQTGTPNGFITSTINIDGTTVDNGNGAFVEDNGHLACRAPN